MEKILVYHPSEVEFQKVKRAAGSLNIRCVRIDPPALKQPLGALVSGAMDPLAAPFSEDAPQESLLVMSDLTDKRMDRLLAALKKSGAQVDFKAIVTPTNRSWNVLRLLVELHAERAAYERMRP